MEALVLIASMVAVLASLFRLVRPIFYSWLHPKPARRTRSRARRIRPKKAELSIQLPDGTTKSVVIDSWFAQKISEEDIRRITQELVDAKPSNEQATDKPTE